MTKNKNDRSSPETTGVDLGDDLIEKTAMLAPATAPRPSTSGHPAELPPVPSDEELLIAKKSSEQNPEPIESRIHSARILMGEGLLEQAKKVLHKILVEDPGRVEARKTLDELHELELKQLFGEETGRRIFGGREKPPQPVDGDEILEQLDRELSLGLEKKDLPALLRDSDALLEFSNRLETELAGVSPQDRIDIGIGFLEMGLPEIAAAQFRAALSESLRERSPDPGLLVSITSLIAVAMLAAYKPLDAEFALQPLLNDTDIPKEMKVELFYLMGRAQEQIGRHDMAAGWFRQVAEISPKYRDVRERLAKTR